MNKGTKETLKVLVVTDGFIPTFFIVHRDLLDILQQDSLLSYEMVTTQRLTQVNPLNYGVVIFSRTRSNESLKFMDLCNYWGCCTLYYLDDYLLDLPRESHNNQNYSEKLLVNLHIAKANGVIAATSYLSNLCLPVNKNVYVLPTTIKLIKNNSKSSEIINNNENRILISYTDFLPLSKSEKSFFVNNLYRILDYDKKACIDIFTMGKDIMHHPRVKYRNLMGYESFYDYINGRYNFGIAPLYQDFKKNSPMQHYILSKSPIKYLMFANFGICGLYSKSPVYMQSELAEGGVYFNNQSQELFSSYKELLGSPGKYREKVTKAFSIIKDNYENNKVARIYWDIIQDVLVKRQSKISNDNKLGQALYKLTEKYTLHCLFKSRLQFIKKVIKK